MAIGSGEVADSAGVEAPLDGANATGSADGDPVDGDPVDGDVVDGDVVDGDVVDGDVVDGDPVDGDVVDGDVVDGDPVEGDVVDGDRSAFCQKAVALNDLAFDADGSELLREEMDARSAEVDVSGLLGELSAAAPPELDLEREDISNDEIDDYLESECGLGRAMGVIERMISGGLDELSDDSISQETAVGRWSGVPRDATVDEALDAFSFATFYEFDGRSMEAQSVTTALGPVVIALPAGWVVDGAIWVPEGIPGDPTMTLLRTCLGDCSPRRWVSAIDGGRVAPIWPTLDDGEEVSSSGSVSTESEWGMKVETRDLETVDRLASTTLFHNDDAEHVVVCRVEATSAIDRELFDELNNACTAMFPVNYPPG